MIRVPFPIPSPAREELIAAGNAAVNFNLNSPEREEAGERVRDILDKIVTRYGVECDEENES